jgi:hypothetical protein
VTDPRLHSEQPIDDEVPFEDASTLPRDEAAQDEDAIVKPAAAQREQRLEDKDRAPSRPGSGDAEEGAS